MLALQLGGCAAPAESGPKAKVGRIEVSYVDKLEERIQETGALAAIAAGVETELRRSDLYSRQGSLSLFVRVISFRLRSEKTFGWWGGWAGFDKLGVEVRVQRGDGLVKKFKARQERAGGAKGELGGTRPARLSRLVKKVGEDIAEKLHQIDIWDPADGF